jgi:uncharacterized membrane protein
LAVVLPPLLTIVIFVWVGNTVAVYVLEPLESAVRSTLVWTHRDQIRNGLPNVTPEGTAIVEIDGRQVVYRRAGDGRFIPAAVYETVSAKSPGPMPSTALGIYDRYVEIVYLQRYVVVPVFLCLFIILLYLLGKFLAAGVGTFFLNSVERGIHKLPFIRNVYSSVKQVTDFMFSERDIEYTRVVAVEYPRKGIWSLGLVTGNGMLDIRNAAEEPVLSVLVPTSPMPVTGFTVTIKRSETVDLNISIDQAFQFIVSCGVVVPPQQVLEGQAQARIKGGNGQTLPDRPGQAPPGTGPA